MCVDGQELAAVRSVSRVAKNQLDAGLDSVHGAARRLMRKRLGMRGQADSSSGKAPKDNGIGGNPAKSLARWCVVGFGIASEAREGVRASIGKAKKKVGLDENGEETFVPSERRGPRAGSCEENGNQANVLKRMQKIVGSVYPERPEMPMALEESRTQEEFSVAVVPNSSPDFRQVVRPRSSRQPCPVS